MVLALLLVLGWGVVLCGTPESLYRDFQLMVLFFCMGFELRHSHYWRNSK